MSNPGRASQPGARGCYAPPPQSSQPPPGPRGPPARIQPRARGKAPLGGTPMPLCSSAALRVWPGSHRFSPEQLAAWPGMAGVGGAGTGGLATGPFSSEDGGEGRGVWAAHWEPGPGEAGTSGAHMGPPGPQPSPGRAAPLGPHLAVVGLTVGQALPLIVPVPPERLLALGTDEVLGGEGAGTSGGAVTLRQDQGRSSSLGSQALGPWGCPASPHAQ